MIHLSAGVADSRRRTLTGGDDQLEHVRAGIVHEDFVGHERRLAIYRPTRHKVSWHFDILFNRYTAHKVDFVIVRPTQMVASWKRDLSLWKQTRKIAGE